MLPKMEMIAEFYTLMPLYPNIYNN